MGIIHAKNRESGALDPGPNQDDARPTVAHDEVFGDITEDGPNYRDVRASHRSSAVSNSY